MINNNNNNILQLKHSGIEGMKAIWAHLRPLERSSASQWSKQVRALVEHLPSFVFYFFVILLLEMGLIPRSLLRSSVPISRLKKYPAACCDWDFLFFCYFFAILYLYLIFSKYSFSMRLSRALQ
mgnify:CR=1 FL=1